jgi:MraZ protein
MICDGLNNDCPVFLGQYNHTIDDKGRLAVPMKFREALARGAVVTRGLDSSLFLLPVEEWGKLATTIADLPLGQSNARAFARLMLAGAMDVALDKQGRCIVPEYLRQYAGLKKDVVIVGINTRLELWDAERWATYVAQTEKDAESIAEKLGELGI